MSHLPEFGDSEIIDPRLERLPTPQLRPLPPGAGVWVGDAPPEDTAKHSPLPWAYNGVVITDANGDVLMGSDKSHIELNANAHLIVDSVNTLQIIDDSNAMTQPAPPLNQWLPASIRLDKDMTPDVVVTRLRSLYDNETIATLILELAECDVPAIVEPLRKHLASQLTPGQQTMLQAIVILLEANDA